MRVLGTVRRHVRSCHTESVRCSPRCQSAMSRRPTRLCVARESAKSSMSRRPSRCEFARGGRLLAEHCLSSLFPSVTRPEGLQQWATSPAAGNAEFVARVQPRMSDEFLQSDPARSAPIIPP